MGLIQDRITSLVQGAQGRVATIRQAGAGDRLICPRACTARDVCYTTRMMLD